MMCLKLNLNCKAHCNARFLVTEYADGGELFDYIVTHKNMVESDAKRFFFQIVSALDYCHRYQILFPFFNF